MTQSPPTSPPTDAPACLEAHEVQVVADRDGLAQCLQLVESVCTRLALGDEDAQAVRLAVEEACSNVVDHGYADTAPGPLGLRLCLTAPDLLEAWVDDQAPPFHPDQAPAPDLLSDSDDRPIGGLGWFFIRQVMTEVDYTSTAQGNRLTLRRKLATPVAAATATGGTV
jgi:serine/threonine-protein kinase RsbW